MHRPPRIGFIGFGEAGSHMAKGFRESGVDSLATFDINANAPRVGPTIRQRAADTNTKLVDSPAALSETSEIIISTVTASAALEASAQIVPSLRDTHLYADLNSISPGLKRQIFETVSATGASFVEAAVMSPIPPYAHRAPMLLGGPGAPRFVETLSPFGMRLEIVSEGVGVAAATKMCRSIIVKGLEALLFECTLGASQYGAEDRVFASLAETFPGMNWKKMADYMIGRAVVHGERRAREMEEVAATLAAVDVEPIMADATVRRQDWAAGLGLAAHFGPEGPKSYKEVLEILAQK